MARHILLVGDSRRLDEAFHALGICEDDIGTVVTSPPYKVEDGFSIEMIGAVAEQMNGHVRGPLWINFGHSIGHPWRATEAIEEIEMMGNFELVQPIVWHKSGHFTPHRSMRAFNWTHETIYLMSPTRHKAVIDRTAEGVGVPYKDKSNIKRFGHASDIRCPGTVWSIPYDTIQARSQKPHEYPFPVELPRRCIAASMVASGKWVLDPFVGSGTTMVAAEKLEKNSIGVEIAAKHVPVIEERMRQNVEVIYLKDLIGR